MPSASAPPSVIWIAADENTSPDGSFMLPVPRRIDENVCMYQGITAPPKKM
jgi:hypothetical protein